MYVSVPVHMSAAVTHTRRCICSSSLNTLDVVSSYYCPLHTQRYCSALALTNPFLHCCYCNYYLLLLLLLLLLLFNTEARKREVEAAAGPVLAADSAASAVDSIRALVERKNAGLISEEEFQAAKAQTLEMVRLQQLAGMPLTNNNATLCVHNIVLQYCLLFVHHKILASCIV
jgi:hypothetical protein